jgi:ATP-dependent Clp endopeptidase proteolytic subunit ClpP
MTSPVLLTTFSMRTTAPPAGAEWYKIVEDKAASKAKVYIYDEIGMWGVNAKDFAAQIDAIEAKEIELHLNTPGGSVFDGLAICASLKGHKATVKGYVNGMAASAGSFILQACDERYIMRNAMVMIHDAKAYAGGNAEQMRAAATLLDRVSDNIADMYAVRSGQGDVKSWRATMKAGDEWYTGNEALDAGLVDGVVDNPPDEDAPEESTKNAWTTTEVEAYLATPPEKLAKVAACIITNRVEETHMTGENPTQQTAPAVPPIPAAPAAPVAQQTAPAPASVQPTATTQTFMVNGTAITDLGVVQNHISTLEAFRTDTIQAERRSFVNELAAKQKILATQIDDMAEFALALSPEMYVKWKASYEAAPAMSLTAPHGVTPGDKSAPDNGVEAAKASQITDLEYVVQSLRDSGLTQEQIEASTSFKQLTALKTPAS